MECQETCKTSIGQFENVKNTVDDHSKLFDKYEQIIASSISNSKLDAKLDIFKSDIIRHIEEMLNSFNIRVLRGINNKIDKKVELVHAFYCNLASLGFQGWNCK